MIWIKYVCAVQLPGGSLYRLHFFQKESNISSFHSNGEVVYSEMTICHGETAELSVVLRVDNVRLTFQMHFT